MPASLYLAAGIFCILPPEKMLAFSTDLKYRSYFHLNFNY